MMSFVLVAYVRSITLNWSFSVDQNFFKVKVTFNHSTKVSKFLDLQKKRTFHQLTKVLNNKTWSVDRKSLKDQIFWYTEKITFDQLTKMKNPSIYWKMAQKNFWYSEKSQKDHFWLTEIWSVSPFACKLRTFYFKNCCFATQIKKQKNKHFF